MPKSNQTPTNQDWQARLDLLTNEVREIELQIEHLKSVDFTGKSPVPIGCHPIEVRPPGYDCEIRYKGNTAVEVLQEVEKLTGAVGDGFRDLRRSLARRAKAGES